MVPESGLWQSTKGLHRPSAKAEERAVTGPALKVASSAIADRRLRENSIDYDELLPGPY